MLRNVGTALPEIDDNVLFSGVALSYALFFITLYRAHPPRRFGALLEICGFEILLILALAVSGEYRFRFLHIVLFHFIYWNLYPIPMMWRAGAGKLMRFIAMTVVFSVVFLLLSPIGMFGGDMETIKLYRGQFFLWSYIHITASFVLSNSHPKWIVSLFRPQVAAKMDA